MPTRGSVGAIIVGQVVPEAFEARIPGLYGVAYPIRFALKRRGVAESDVTLVRVPGAYEMPLAAGLQHERDLFAS